MHAWLWESRVEEEGRQESKGKEKRINGISENMKRATSIFLKSNA